MLDPKTAITLGNTDPLKVLELVNIEQVQFYPIVDVPQDASIPQIPMQGVGVSTSLRLAFSPEQFQAYEEAGKRDGIPCATVIATDDNETARALFNCDTLYRIFCGPGTKYVKLDHLIVNSRTTGITCLVCPDTQEISLLATPPHLTINGVTLKEGDMVTVDGRRGIVYPGKQPIVEVPSYTQKLDEMARRALPSDSIKVNAQDAMSVNMATTQTAPDEGMGLYRTESLVTRALLNACTTLLAPPKPEIVTPSPSVNTVLVVDDDDAIREFMTVMLEYEGYKVYATTNKKEALETLRTIPSNTNLAITTDFLLPDTNGPALIAEIRKSHPNTPVFLLTAKMAYEVDRDIQGLGNVTYIQKPFDIDPVLETIAKAFGQPSETAPPLPAPSPIPKDPVPIVHSAEDIARTVQLLAEMSPGLVVEPSHYKAIREAFILILGNQIGTELVNPYREANEARAIPHTAFEVNYRLTDLESPQLGITIGEVTPDAKARFFALQAEVLFRRYEDTRGKIEPNIMNILVPSIKSSDELDAIKAAIGEVAIAHGVAKEAWKFGAMIESEQAVEIAEHIARNCDFACFGTNDLTAGITGLARDDTALNSAWMKHNKFGQDFSEFGDSPFDAIIPPVEAAMTSAVNDIRKINADFPLCCCGRQVSEDEHSIAVCAALKIGISVSPGDLSFARVTFAHETGVLASAKQKESQAISSQQLGNAAAKATEEFGSTSNSLEDTSGPSSTPSQGPRSTKRAKED